MPEIDFRRTPVTILLAIAIIALEAVCTLDPARRFYYYETCTWASLPTVWDGQLWQPFTTALLHGGLLHAAFNVWWLWVFGQFLEPRLGSPRFLGLRVAGLPSTLPQFIIALLLPTIRRNGVASPGSSMGCSACLGGPLAGSRILRRLQSGHGPPDAGLVRVVHR